MAIRARQQHILEHVNRMGIASVEELARSFEVSEMTIRRDVEHLAQSWLLEKVKGGAQRLPEAARFHENHLRARMKQNVPAKQQLAAKALSLIEPGDTLFLDGSTTIVCLAQILAQVNRSVTVLTNSVLVVLELAEAKNVRLISLGGVFDPETFSFCPMDNDELLPGYHVKKAFLSCTGFVPVEGTYENSVFNLAIKRKVARCADTVHLLVDAGKLDRRGLNRVLRTDELDVLITEKPFNSEQAALLSAHHVQVLTVG